MKRLLSVLLVLSMLLGLVLTGCSSTPANDPVKTEDVKKEEVETKDEQNAVKPPKPVMVAASQMPGSLYVTYISSWATILNDNFEGLTVDQQPGGSSQNMVLVHNKEVDFGITTAATAYMGWHGIEWAKGVKYDNLRALCPAYPAVLGMFTMPNSGIDSIQDWQGKTIHVGPSGSASDVFARQIVDLFQLKDVKFANSPWSDAGDMIKDGLADSVCYIAGHPVGFAQELEVSGELKVYGLTEEEIKIVNEKYPYYQDFEIPAGTYKALKEDLTTLVAFNLLFCDPDLPEDFVYNVVKETYENVEVLKTANPTFEYTDPEYIRYIPIPFHDGAIKYYKELGLEIPELPVAPTN